MVLGFWRHNSLFWKCCRTKTCNLQELKRKSRALSLFDTIATKSAAVVAQQPLEAPLAALKQKLEEQLKFLQRHCKELELSLEVSCRKCPSSNLVLCACAWCRRVFFKFGAKNILLATRSSVHVWYIFGLFSRLKPNMRLLKHMRFFKTFCTLKCGMLAFGADSRWAGGILSGSSC